MTKQYYKERNGSDYIKYTKDEIKTIVNPFIEESFIPLLKDMNYPYITDVWLNTLKTCIERNHYLTSCFGKYIAKMRLKGYSYYTREDTKFFNDAAFERYSTEV